MGGRGASQLTNRFHAGEMRSGSSLKIRRMRRRRRGWKRERRKGNVLIVEPPPSPPLPLPRSPGGYSGRRERIKKWKESTGCARITSGII